jgi:trimeric autotransporter adhesin
MDQLQTRLDALEQQMYTVNRRLRWWRGLACGLAVVSLLGWGLPLGLAKDGEHGKDKDQKGLAQRVAALEQLLQHFSREDNEVFITGANLHLVNGLGHTDCGSEEEPIPNCPNGLGNLIVGYNEPRPVGVSPPDMRTGSHNIVVGQEQNFSRFGGIVVGFRNEISGEFASITGGESNVASGRVSSVIGGRDNTASGDLSSVSGGDFNTASGPGASVSGGVFGRAVGLLASVSGGSERTAEGEFDWVAGSLFEDQ